MVDFLNVGLNNLTNWSKPSRHTGHICVFTALFILQCYQSLRLYSIKNHIS